MQGRTIIFTCYKHRRTLFINDDRYDRSFFKLIFGLCKPRKFSLHWISNFKTSFKSCLLYVSYICLLWKYYYSSCSCIKMKNIKPLSHVILDLTLYTFKSWLLTLDTLVFENLCLFLCMNHGDFESWWMNDDTMIDHYGPI